MFFKLSIAALFVPVASVGSLPGVGLCLHWFGYSDAAKAVLNAYCTIMF